MSLVTTLVPLTVQMVRIGGFLGCALWSEHYNNNNNKKTITRTCQTLSLTRRRGQLPGAWPDGVAYVNC